MGRTRIEVLPPQHMLLEYDVNICAPMVRYSKRAFRATCARYDTQWTTTPMIVAKEFSRSPIAREADFSTSSTERGLFEPVRDRRRRRKGMLSDHGDEEEDGEEDGMEDIRHRALVGEHTQWISSLRTSLLRTGSSDQSASDEDQDDEDGLDPPPRLLRGTLIGQLAASESKTLADGAEILAPHVDGIELNCGCPTSSAWSDHIGAYLLRQPDLVRDMVRTLKARLGAPYPVCVKIRLDPDLRRTETLVRNAIEAGASVLTVHGRTRSQSSASNPVNLEGIAFAIDVARRCGSRTACGAVSAMHSLSSSSPSSGPEGDDIQAALVGGGGGGAGGPMPCVANGDVFTLDEAREWRRRTGAQGVMSARGLLANPALFAGYDVTPPEAVSYFAKEALRGGNLPFQLFHRHVGYMLESVLPRSDAVYFNSLASTGAVVDWLHDEGWWKG